MKRLDNGVNEIGKGRHPSPKFSSLESVTTDVEAGADS